jgi:rubredoxin
MRFECPNCGWAYECEDLEEMQWVFGEIIYPSGDKNE